MLCKVRVWRMVAKLPVISTDEPKKVAVASVAIVLDFVMFIVISTVTPSSEHV